MELGCSWHKYIALLNCITYKFVFTDAKKLVHEHEKKKINFLWLFQKLPRNQAVVSGFQRNKWQYNPNCIEILAK